jgi:hypothetical protein
MSKGRIEHYKKKCLPANHSTLAFSLADIAEVYWRKGELMTALEYHILAFELRR